MGKIPYELEFGLILEVLKYLLAVDYSLFSSQQAILKFLQFVLFVFVIGGDITYDTIQIQIRERIGCFNLVLPSFRMFRQPQYAVKFQPADLL